MQLLSVLAFGSHRLARAHRPSAGALQARTGPVPIPASVRSSKHSRAWTRKSGGRLSGSGKRSQAIAAGSASMCDLLRARKPWSRFAYLSPIVLERLVAHRRPCSLSIKDLIAAAERPWCEQEALMFEN